MTHIERIFSKQITELVYSDIEEYFSEPQIETDFIEFKSFDSSRTIPQNFDLIHRAFCAFLNSEGGVIIWGAPRSTGSGNEIVFGGEGQQLRPITSVPAKDQMVNILSGKITPLPNSFQLTVIANYDNTQSIIVIEIVKSEYSPHQYNNFYYMRMDGQTRYAPHHYIEALFKQIKFPQIEAYIKFGSLNVHMSQEYRFPVEIMVFNYSPLQNESDIICDLTTAKGSFMSATSSPYRSFNFNGKQVILRKGSDALSFGAPFLFRETIQIPFTEITERENESVLELILKVVGKTSPARMSKYKIELYPLTHGADGNSRLSEKIENKFMINYQNETGLSKAEQLRIILGREV